MNQKNDKLSNGILYIIYLGFCLIFLLPLLVKNGFYFPYATTKGFAFRIIVESQFFLWFFLAIINKKFRPKIYSLQLFILAFILIISIANIFSIDPYKSFFGNLERMDGLLNIIHFFAYMLLTTTCLETKKQWSFLANFSMMVAFFVSVIGCVSLFDEPISLISSTFGNSSYLAIYMVFHIFISMIFYFENYEKNKLYSYFYLFFTALFVFVLYNTGARGSLLGLALGSIFTLFLSLRHKKQKVFSKKILFLSVGGFFLIGIIFWQFRDSAVVKKSTTLARIVSVNSVSSDGTSLSTTTLRFKLWKIALKGIQERPLLGWGQENYEYVFDRYYDPALGDAESWFDRSHNGFLDWILATGIFGGLAYLLIYFASFYFLWKSPKNNEDQISLANKAILSGLLIAYFIHIFFMFDYLISYLFFFSLLAYITKRSGSSFNLATKSRLVIPVVGSCFLMFMCYSFYAINLPAIKASQNILESITLVKDGKGQEAYRKINEAIKHNSFATREAKEQLGKIASSINIDIKIPKINRINDINQISKKLIALRNEHPQALKKSFPLMILASQLNDPGIENLFESILKISPQRQSLYEEMIYYYFKKEQFAKAQTTAEINYNLNKNVYRSKALYALSALLNKNIELRDKLLEGLPLEHYVHNNRFIQGYLALDRPDKIIEHYKKMSTFDPKDKIAHLKLAIFYSELEMPKESEAEFAKARFLEH